MIWGPFLLALALGLIVSAGLYFAYMWPQVEPEDDDEAAPDAAAGPAHGATAAKEAEAPTPPETTAESSPA